MTQCPYPETSTNPVSVNIEENDLYTAWHEGYESHKLDLMMKTAYIKTCMLEFLAEARKVSELKRELKKQRSELEQKNSTI